LAKEREGRDDLLAVIKARDKGCDKSTMENAKLLVENDGLNVVRSKLAASEKSNKAAEIKHSSLAIANATLLAENISLRDELDAANDSSVDGIMTEIKAA
jgi:hypothetical protein